MKYVYWNFKQNPIPYSAIPFPQFCLDFGSHLDRPTVGIIFLASPTFGCVLFGLRQLTWIQQILTKPLLGANLCARQCPIVSRSDTEPMAENSVCTRGQRRWDRKTVWAHKPLPWHETHKVPWERSPTNDFSRAQRWKIPVWLGKWEMLYGVSKCEIKVQKINHRLN